MIHMSLHEKKQLQCHLQKIKKMAQSHQKLLTQENLTREVIDMFIEDITIAANGTVDIKFKCQDQFLTILDNLQDCEVVGYE